MTISIKKECSDLSAKAHPILLYANWCQFAPAERINHSRVESRMFLSIHRGAGTLRVNGETLSVRSGQWFYLPWGHSLEYWADKEKPFFVGGIHLIPDHEPGHAICNEVAHGPKDSLAGVSYRRDVNGSRGQGLWQGLFQPGQGRLNALVHYLIESFDPLVPDEAKQRIAAQWLLEEMRRFREDLPSAGSAAAPVALLRVEAYVRENLQRPLAVPDLARVGRSSVAGIHRMFRTWRNTSPARWVAAQRMEKAVFLLRTSRWPVKEIAEQVGIADPFQFSRCFKRELGLSPRAYRQQQGRL